MLLAQWNQSMLIPVGGRYGYPPEIILIITFIDDLGGGMPKALERNCGRRRNCRLLTYLAACVNHAGNSWCKSGTPCPDSFPSNLIDAV